MPEILTTQRIAATGQLATLRSAASVATDLAVPLYWVGGGVRDLLLGRDRLDLDLVVEGDVDALTARLAKIAAGSVSHHPRFQTATLRFLNGLRIDLARARRETYAAVAALPRIEAATLDEDLRRRDFTINAMAIVLAPEARFGTLIDPLGGQADLAAGCLRIHHPRSFMDDPTRILRGIRFEIRFGFHFDAATERLAREAIAGGALDRLSASRFGAEVARLFDDGGSPQRILARLAELGIWNELQLDRVTWIAPPEMPPGLEPGRWRSALLAISISCDPGEREALASRLGLSPGDRILMLEGPRRVREAVSSLARMDLTPSQALAELAPLSDEELARAASESEPARAWIERYVRELRPFRLEIDSEPARAWIERYVRELRPFRLEIGGADLVASGVEPGPGLGRALRRTQEARLDGTIDAADELRFALEQCRAETSR